MLAPIVRGAVGHGEPARSSSGSPPPRAGRRRPRELGEASGIDPRPAHPGTLVLGPRSRRGRGARPRGPLREELGLPSPAAAERRPARGAALAPTLRAALRGRRRPHRRPASGGARRSRAATRGAGARRCGAGGVAVDALRRCRPTRSWSPPGRGRPPSARRRACARSRASRCGLRDPSGPGLRNASCAGPAQPRLPRPARRRALRPRRDLRGARLRHHGHRRRRATSCCATPTSWCPAFSSSRSRSTSPACAPARRTTRRSSGARRRPAGSCWATGHYRNGVLLTPLTADLVAAELAGEGVRARLRA